MAGVYLNQLEALLGRVHPGIRSLRVAPVAGRREALLVIVTADPSDQPSILEALRRSEPSLRPQGFVFEYSCSEPRTGP